MAPRYKLARDQTGATLLYDSQTQRRPGEVTFFHLSLDMEVYYSRDYAKSNLVRIVEPLSEAIWRYERWQKATAVLTQIRHRQRLVRRGLMYKGSTTLVVADRRRTDHCFSCRARVDSAIHALCAVCTLRNIICPNCGACGCSFESPEDPQSEAFDPADNDDIEKWFLFEGDRLTFPPGQADSWKLAAADRTERRKMYHAFLETSTWRRIRLVALANANNRCERCGADDRTLNVHHRTYERVGGREVPDDLEVLCEPCHVRHHEYLDAYMEFVKGSSNHDDLAAI